MAITGNVFDRPFSADARNRKRVADFTYVGTTGHVCARLCRDGDAIAVKGSDSNETCTLNGRLLACIF